MNLDNLNSLIELFFYQADKQDKKSIFLQWLNPNNKKTYTWEETQQNIFKLSKIIKENMFKQLYLKTINLAGHKSSKFFLGIMSFIESFVFPIPPDVLIILKYFFVFLPTYMFFYYLDLTIVKKYYFYFVYLLDKKIIQLGCLNYLNS